MHYESMLMGVYSSSDAVERRAVALSNYINDINATLSTTDSDMYPRYTRRMVLELKLAREELDQLKNPES